MFSFFSQLQHNITSIQSSNLSNNQVYLLQAVIESFVDGILILSRNGDLLHANDSARSTCHELSQKSSDTVPEEIWQICESFIESRQLFPGENIFMEYELENTRIKLRIRVRWLSRDDKQKFLLVTLEDFNQSTQSIAIADAKKYGLTHREAEVWLLRRANLSYKEIAEKLFITINTVKKHLKNIYAKQNEIICIQ
jgi:DNA-binding CsgD family transcriptional regulator